MYLFSKLILCFTFLITSKCQVEDEGCQTPEGGIGNCIPVRQCRPMLLALQTVKRPISSQVSEEINRYVCSYKNNLAHICCPNGPIVFQSDEPSPNEYRSPPDVSIHRNLGLLPTDCGYLSPSEDRISNGVDADLNEFPWMALLSYRTRTGPQFKCGGSIINDQYILTAAHCVKDTESPLLGIRVGEYNILSKTDCQKQPNGSTKCNPGVQDLAIQEIIHHPQFNGTIISNDIALIRVTRMNLNVENARPVCLPTGEYRDEVFENVIVTGWGIQDIQTRQMANILQQVSVPVVELETCKRIYKNRSRASLTYKQVCAGGKNNKDACAGDSGGPMHTAGYIYDAARYVQQGIVSYGTRECGIEGYPSVYTRVAYYMDWILDTIRP